MDRRGFLQFGLVMTTGIAGGCRWSEQTPSEPGVSVDAELIDVHCHVFNASDLPMVRFVTQVVGKIYPEQGEVKTFDVRDSGIADHAVKLLLRVMGSNSAPTAREEVSFLDGKTSSASTPLTETAAKERGRQVTADYINELIQANGGPDIMAAPSGQRNKTTGGQLFLEELMRASGTMAPMDKQLSPQIAKTMSINLFRGISTIGRYLQWFSLFRLYRHTLVDILVKDTKAQGFEPKLLTPAIIDYDEWLYEDVTRSPLDDQIEVMDRIARRTTGPAVHGYLGYDPLREVLYRAGRRRISPLHLARKALEAHGFVGIKLYPPMGFRPLKNEGPYHAPIERELGITGKALSRELDSALNDLYRLCEELDAPVLAHGADTNASGDKYSSRADPAYWLPVFSQYKSLRVCIAHFGGFDTPSAGKKKSDLPTSSWEWVLGGQFKAKASQPVFADLSYFSEIINAKPARRQKIADALKVFVETFDPKVEHLLFGTDWLMLGQEAGYKSYIKQVNAFLKDDCGWPDDARRRFFSENACRFLPLAPGTVGRERLLSFYKRHNLNPERLPVPAREGILARWLR